MKQGFLAPQYVGSFDCETVYGEILTLQMNSENYQTGRGYHERIKWVSHATVLDEFLNYYGRLEGFVVLFGFNIKFDAPLVFRQFIELFLHDDFAIRYREWGIRMFCSTNWFCVLENRKTSIMLVDVRSYFQRGSLAKVSQDFKLPIEKLEKPEALGNYRYSKRDTGFVQYALQDIRLTLGIGKQILKMHEEFDIPMSSSFANMSEKVFRRMFLEDGERIQYPPHEAQRLAEICYHGGKNGYYHDGPTDYGKVYEYDFNSAYPFAMYDMPNFSQGEFVKVNTLSDKYEGFYEVSGKLGGCRYGIFYDDGFHYYRNQNAAKVICRVSSYELREAIRAREFKIDRIIGWVWKPDDARNPLKEYTSYFWQKKQSTPKEDVHYLFYKLFLNSLYGKFIQRNPFDRDKVMKLRESDFLMQDTDLVSGGLYNPFIGAMITAHCRARLHQNEHKLEAIDCSTDSIKSAHYDPEYKKDYLGRMRLETYHCKTCQKSYSHFNGVFVRNRLNLLLCRAGHVVKGAMHGFWGSKEDLLTVYEGRLTSYEVTRMPLIREGLKQEGKPLFQFFTETRSLNIEWQKLQKF